MTLRLIGALLIVLGCGGFGFLIAASHKKKVAELKQLIYALEYMECELQYRLTPLPELCRRVSAVCTGKLKTVFEGFSDELEAQVSPDPDSCMSSVINKSSNLSDFLTQALTMLGRSLGHFGLEGQMNGIRAVCEQCSKNLESLTDNQDNRIRSYQTLGLCAGAALAILLI